MGGNIVAMAILSSESSLFVTIKILYDCKAELMHSVPHLTSIFVPCTLPDSFSYSVANDCK